MNQIKLFVIGALAAILIACGQSATNNSASNPDKAGAPASAPATSPQPKIMSGNELYIENCQICHQDTAKGGKNLTIKGKKLSPADLTSDKIKNKSDDELVKEITEGVPDEGMPSFKDKLKPEEMKRIVEYLRKLQGKVS